MIFYFNFVIFYIFSFLFHSYIDIYIQYYYYSLLIIINNHKELILSSNFFKTLEIFKFSSFSFENIGIYYIIEFMPFMRNNYYIQQFHGSMSRRKSDCNLFNDIVVNLNRKTFYRHRLLLQRKQYFYCYIKYTFQSSCTRCQLIIFSSGLSV